MQSYRNLIVSSGKISWSNKYLWFFGLFAMLLGFGVEYDFALNYYFLSEGGGYAFFQKLSGLGLFSGKFLVSFVKALSNDPINGGIILVIVLMFLFLLGFLIWLAIISNIAIIDGAAKKLSGKESNFREGIEKGIRRFWPAFLLVAVQKIAVLVLAFSLVFFIIAMGPKIKILYLVFFVISLVLSFVVKYALSYLIIKDLPAKESVLSGWKLFKKNWLATIEADIVLFFAYGIISLVMLMCIMNLKILVAFFTVMISQLSETLGFWFLVLASVGVALFVILAGALVAIFYTTAWTAIFYELIGGGMSSRIARFFIRSK